LQTVIEHHLTAPEKVLLDGLLDNSCASTTHERPGRYPLTFLKQITQSMQPKAIAERVALFNQLKQLFMPLAPVIVRLDLSDDTLRMPSMYSIIHRHTSLSGSMNGIYGCWHLSAISISR
jgi:hypothetical protein